MPPTPRRAAGPGQRRPIAAIRGRRHERRIPPIPPADSDGGGSIPHAATARLADAGRLGPPGAEPSLALASPAASPPASGPVHAGSSSRRKAAAAPLARRRPPRRAGGLVFALGQVGYDLVSEARRDSIAPAHGRSGANPSDPSQMLGYLKDNPWEAASITWTLNADQTPLYAIAPAGPVRRPSVRIAAGVPGRAASRRDRAGLDRRAAGRPGAAVQRPGRAGGGPRAARGL